MEWHRAAAARITTKTVLAFCLFLAATTGTVASASSASTTTFDFVKNHQLYDRGEDIRSLQEFFNTHGFIIAQNGPGSPGNETSFFGLLTYRTLKEFQSAHGLPTTGFLGPLTRAVINSGEAASNSTPTTVLQNTPSTNSVTTATTTASTTPSLPSWYTKPLPGYAPGQLIFGGGSAPTPSPTCTMSASPASIAIGSSTSLTWASPNASSASLSNVGSVATVGSESVSPSTTTTYTLTVTNGTGSAACNTTVTASDRTPPTAPANLTAVAASLSALNLSWTASTDNVGVAGYQIFRDGAQIATATLTTYADTGLTASSTHAYTVKAYDAAGNVSLSSNTATSTTGLWADGFAAAPAGTAQYPNILQGYVARAPWRVAGVDYAVGITPGTVLKDPATIGSSIPGVSVSGNVITISGNSVTLSGYDFSLEGGWGVQVVGNNDTISNNYFKIGASAVDPINTGGSDIHSVTIVNNVIDGSGIKPSFNVGLIWLLDQGTSTIEYNLIENAYTTAIQESISGSSGSASQAGQIIQYNVIANTGLGYTIDGSHGDFVQDFGVAQASSTQVFNNIQVNYNTLIENNPLSSGQGLSILSAGGNINTYALQESVQNNTAVLSNTGGIAYGIGIIDTTWLTGTATFANNYVDPTGANYGPYFIGQYNGAGQNPTNGATSVGSNLLYFSSTAQPFWQDNPVSAGELVYDITNPSAIPVGTTVTSVGATTVTLSANATGSGVANGDSIRVGDGPTSGAVSKFNSINMLTGAGL